MMMMMMMMTAMRVWIKDSITGQNINSFKKTTTYFNKSIIAVKLDDVS